MTVQPADFQKIREEANATSKRYRGNIDGGGNICEESNVILKQVRLEPTEDGLLLTALHHGIPDSAQAQFEDFPRQTCIEMTPGSVGFPADWQGQQELRMQVRCGKAPMTVEFVLVGARGRLTQTKNLAGGKSQDFVLDLIDLPLMQGRMPAFEPTGIRINMLWHGSDEPRTLTVTQLELVAGDGTVRPCVDRFGQRINSDWPGKVHRDDDMRQAIQTELADFAAMPAPPQRNRFGGWTGGERFEASGYFRIEQDKNGRWWYVDPEGCPFWSVGCTGIRYSDDTPIEGREHLFAELPEREGPFAAAYGRYVPLTGTRDAERETVSFYRWNILRKWGSFDAWAQRVVARLQKWGYNTVANWSNAEMMEQKSVPHVRSLSTRGPLECHVTGGFFDVWDPRWEAYFHDVCANAAKIEGGNPWLIGYFVDNELGWRRPKLLDAAPDAALRTAWGNLVRKRYPELEHLNQAMGRSFSSWQEVEQMQDAELPEEGAGGELRRELENAYAETYFSNIRRILKQHDPDHLYMGCRFIRQPPRREIVAAAGRYVDVLSVNCYSLVPDREAFQQWYDWAQRPIQIGEHQLSAYGPRQLPQLWTCFTHAERQQWYPAFDETFARMPFSVGSHWFQYADQVITGRPSNGENQIIGLVDITDRPHDDMVAAARVIASQIYDWHSQSA